MIARKPATWTLGLLLAGIAAPVQAQIKASERGGAYQTIDGTTITVDYSRPRARGRSPLFGGDVVHWGHVWTPGADSATTLAIDKPVTIQDTDVPVGKYSVWFVVKDTTAWEVRLDPVHERFHLPEPEPHDSLITFMADVQQRDTFYEALTWWFPDIRMDGAILAVQWGTTYVPLNIEVEPTIELTVLPAAAAPILGTYEMTAEGERPWWNRRIEIVYDSSGMWPRSTWFEREVAEAGEAGGDQKADGAEADVEEGEEEDEDPPWEAALLQVADEWFTPAWLQDGKLWSAGGSMTLEFTMHHGHATGFELRDRKDEVVATARRIE